MKTLLSISGYLLAAGACFIAYEQFQQLDRLQQQIHHYSLQTTEVSKDLAVKYKQCDPYKNEITQLKNALSHSQNELSNLYLSIDTLQETVNAEYEQLVRQVFQDAATKREVNAIDKHISPELSDSMAKMQVNSLYNDYLNNLDTYDERKEEIRQLLIDTLANQRQISLQVAAGEISYVEAAELIGDDAISSALSSMLTDEELQQFNSYQQNQTSHQYRKSYESQLAMLAPNLSNSSKELVLDTLVTEMVSVHKQYADINDVQSVTELENMFSGIYDHQSETLENVRNSLSFQLNEQDMSLIDSFFDQLKEQQEITRQMNLSDS